MRRAPGEGRRVSTPLPHCGRGWREAPGEGRPSSAPSLRSGAPSPAEAGEGGWWLAMPLLEARNVTIRFGGLTAVSDFNVSIEPHELVGLIGPNGAGKTTVFNMLTGVYAPTEGEIFVGGKPTAGCKPYDITALGVARTFQNIRIFKELTVLDNVKIGGHIHYKYSGTAAVLHTNRFHEAEEVAERDAIALLHIFDLENRAEDYAKNLPYGDQRRLEIARALAARPKLLLLDEPAAGLNDSETVA